MRRNLTGSKISMCSTKFVFFGPIGKPRWPPRPLIGWDIIDFSSETAEPNGKKLNRKQDLKVLYQVCVFRADRKNKMAPMASDLLRRFWLLLWNCWKEARSQYPLAGLCFSGWSENQDGCPVLYQVCVFRADRKNKMAAMASDLLRRFWLLLWNCWQEARSQYPLASLCFSGWSENQDGCPGLWLVETRFLRHLFI